MGSFYAVYSSWILSLPLIMMITIHSTVPLTTFMKYLIILLVGFEQADSYEICMTPCFSYNDMIKLKTQTDLNKQ